MKALLINFILQQVLGTRDRANKGIYIVNYYVHADKASMRRIETFMYDSNSIHAQRHHSGYRKHLNPHVVMPLKRAFSGRLLFNTKYMRKPRPMFYRSRGVNIERPMTDRLPYLEAATQKYLNNISNYLNKKLRHAQVQTRIMLIRYDKNRMHSLKQKVCNEYTNAIELADSFRQYVKLNQRSGTKNILIMKCHNSTAGHPKMKYTIQKERCGLIIALFLHDPSHMQEYIFKSIVENEREQSVVNVPGELTKLRIGAMQHAMECNLKDQTNVGWNREGNSVKNNDIIK
ncbi:hypothetical protein ENBRE01_2115 [Enteropsectra breve]|nr:hypothetical protein ENBRE01_2115 [Enteropsectra breve]